MSADKLHEILKAAQSLDELALKKLVAADAVIRSDALLAPLVGPEPLFELITAFHKAFPGLSLDPGRDLERGERAALEFTLAGKHQEPLIYSYVSINRTGRTVKVQGSVIADFENSQLKQATIHWNCMAFLAQLGIRPHMRPDPIEGTIGQ